LLSFGSRRPGTIAPEEQLKPQRSAKKYRGVAHALRLPTAIVVEKV
jgi:hypothetical protein